MSRKTAKYQGECFACSVHICKTVTKEKTKQEPFPISDVMRCALCSSYPVVLSLEGIYSEKDPEKDL